MVVRGASEAATSQSSRSSFRPTLPRIPRRARRIAAFLLSHYYSPGQGRSYLLGTCRAGQRGQMCKMTSNLFESRQQRLDYLELWRELAVRPEKEVCADEDLDMLSGVLEDSLSNLESRCYEARKQMNEALPRCVTKYDHDLVPDDSCVEGAGKGLFFRPSDSSASSGTIIPKDTILTYYYGDIHSFRSSKALKDKSYLMLVDGDILVDPEPHTYILARFINDPINTKYYNCRYEPDAQHFRSNVVATRDIKPGEEIFAPYGEAYWSQQSYEPTILHGQASDNSSNDL